MPFNKVTAIYFYYCVKYINVMLNFKTGSTHTVSDSSEQLWPWQAGSCQKRKVLPTASVALHRSLIIRRSVGNENGCQFMYVHLPPDRDTTALESRAIRRTPLTKHLTEWLVVRLQWECSNRSAESTAAVNCLIWKADVRHTGVRNCTRAETIRN